MQHHTTAPPSALSIIKRGGAWALPLETLISVIPSLPREAAEYLIERMIDRLDQWDGDPDLEDTDREPDDRNRPRPSYEIDQRHHIGHGWRHE